MKVEIKVNGVARSAEVEGRTLLVQWLRDGLGLTGTHVGCETSQCGACTVLAAQADGHEVTTIEGLAPRGMLHPVQQAFWEEHGVQCGYCTPGVLMTTVALLKEQPNPDEATIRHALEGNLCRCTGYQNIVNSVRSAAEKLASGAEPVAYEGR
ncbi:MAG: aerobic carbon-monoxide dehydrogenase small subunit [Thermomicrobiales bacterium]|nr:aerobic carbon-monoxide dehydrogenase small subunit [Thermomicrobiales bacterium]